MVERMGRKGTGTVTSHLKLWSKSEFDSTCFPTLLPYSNSCAPKMVCVVFGFWCGFFFVFCSYHQELPSIYQTLTSHSVSVNSKLSSSSNPSSSSLVFMGKLPIFLPQPVQVLNIKTVQRRKYSFVLLPQCVRGASRHWEGPICCL